MIRHSKYYIIIANNILIVTAKIFDIYKAILKIDD